MDIDSRRTLPRGAPGFQAGKRFELRQLRAFLAVAESLHFGRAAQALFTSQPAVSRLVGALEDAVGTPLLERSTRRVRLTDAGKAFAAECRLAFGHLDLASDAAHRAAQGREGRLRVGYMDFAINGSLPAILRGFREESPGVAVTLEYMPTMVQHEALLQGRIDVAFILGELPARSAANTLVERQQFVALLPEGHRLARRAAVPLADLSTERFVMGSEDSFGSFRPLAFELCHAAGYFPRIVQEASTSSGIFGLVAAGVGVSIYSDCARVTRRAGMVVKPIAGVSARIPICAAWLDGREAPAVERFVSTVRTWARSQAKDRTAR
jgi:DNA-binding transcriptional LysR family regulator